MTNIQEAFIQKMNLISLKQAIEKFKDNEEQKFAKMEAHLIASALEHIDCDGPSEQEIAQKEMELMASAMEHIKAMETLPTEEECAQWADNLVESFFKNRGQTECSGNC